RIISAVGSHPPPFHHLTLTGNLHQSLMNLLHHFAPQLVDQGNHRIQLLFHPPQYRLLFRIRRSLHSAVDLLGEPLRLVPYLPRQAHQLPVFLLHLLFLLLALAPPELLAGDAGFYSAENEREAHALGVQRVSIPNRSTHSAARRQHQKKRWFRKGQKWRTGCEGRISVLKRRHGLNRSRYRGEEGMERWVGFGVVADTLINMGRVLASRRNG